MGVQLNESIRAHVPVAETGACTGFDSGDPCWRRKIVSTTIAATARNSDCQFCSDSNQNWARPR